MRFSSFSMIFILLWLVLWMSTAFVLVFALFFTLLRHVPKLLPSKLGVFFTSFGAVITRAGDRDRNRVYVWPSSQPVQLGRGVAVKEEWSFTTHWCFSGPGSLLWPAPFLPEKRRCHFIAFTGFNINYNSLYFGNLL